MKQSVLTLFIMICITALFSAPVSAKGTQDLLEMETEDLFELSLEELLDAEIRSAGKMAEKVSEIPASVYIMTREEMEQYGFRTVAEVIRNIPGFYSIYDYQDDELGVRGVLSEDNIIVLINGVSRQFNEPCYILFPVEAIDRIEVIRGPMSVMYGSGAFLGAVNIVTNEIPYGEPLQMVSVSYGSGDTHKAFARMSGETDTFRYALNASSYGTDGIEESYADEGEGAYPVSGTDSKEESYTGTDPGDEQHLDPGMENNDPYGHQETDGYLKRENQNFNFSGSFGGLYGDFQYNHTQNGLFDGSSFDEGSSGDIHNIDTRLGYMHTFADTLRMDASVVYNRMELEEVYDFFSPMYYGTSALGFGEGREERIEAELDMVWTPSEAFNMIAGFNYKTVFHSEYSISIPYQGMFTVEPGQEGKKAEKDGRKILYADYETTDRDTYAVFMQMNYKPVRNVKLIAGARLEQSMEYGSTADIEYEGIRGSSFFVHNDEENLYLIPRIAAVWAVTDHHILKLMYGEANKPFSQLDTAMYILEAGSYAGDPEPEEIETVELNYLLSYRSFGISLSLFRNNIENIRAYRLAETENDIYASVMDDSGRMVTYGSEIIVSARPIPNLNLELSLTCQDTEDRAEENRIISHSPNLLMKLKAGWRWRDFSLGISGLYVDEMEPFTDNDFFLSPDLKPSEDYITVSANVRYENPDTGLFAACYVYNLFDEEVRYPATDNAQFVNGLIDEGRSLTATVGWRF